MTFLIIQQFSEACRENKPDNPEPSVAREEDDFILKVARPKLTRPPEPPLEIKSWLESGWDDPSKELAVRKTRNETSAKGETALVRFEDDANRTIALERWQPQREEWARNETPARARRRAF
jgi:hypothetical protein